jgi:hypothetical protein
MNSELAVVTAEIVDILPRDKQTPETKQWLTQSLQDNSVVEVLAACEKYFDVSVAKISACERRLDAQGIKLDRHIEYVDRKFSQYDREISELKQRVAVSEAVNNERAESQRFLNGQIIQTQNSIQSNITNVANKNSGDTNPVTLAFSLAFGVILVSCMAALVIEPKRPIPTQVIEYKNVPSSGHPREIDRKLWEQL